MRRLFSIHTLLATHAVFASFALPDPSVYPPELIIGQPLRIGGVSYSVAVFGGNACRDLRIQSLPETLRSDPGTGCGGIVRTDARGSATVVHRFAPSEGAWPFSLRAGADGTLLGVTALGGTYGQGTSFRFDPKTSRLTVLQSLAESASLGSAGNAFAFDDGSVLAEDDRKSEFLLLADGKSARRLALFRRARLGPFVITPDGRATFLIGAGSRCRVRAADPS